MLYSVGVALILLPVIYPHRLVYLLVLFNLLVHCGYGCCPLPVGDFDVVPIAPLIYYGYCPDSMCGYSTDLTLAGSYTHLLFASVTVDYGCSTLIVPPYHDSVLNRNS